MDLFCICRICLNESNEDLVSIYSFMAPGEMTSNKQEIKEYNMQISTILDDLTFNKYPSTEFPNPDKICKMCLADLKIVVDFRNRCEIAFDQLMKLSVNCKNFNQTETLDQDNITFVDTLSPCIEDPDNYPVKAENCPISDQLEMKDDEAHHSDYGIEAVMRPSSPQEKLLPEAKIQSKAKTHRKTKSCQCNICNKVFTRPEHLRRHMITHSDERKFACKMCDKKFRRADHLKNHQSCHLKLDQTQTMHPDDITFVDTLSTSIEVTDDFPIKSSNSPIPDELEVESNDRYSDTEETYHKMETQSSPSIAEEKLHAETKIDPKAKIRSEAKSHQCDICKKEFTRLTHLRRHMTTHSDERKFACKMCDKKFRRADHLKIHENYHLQIKPHFCEQCQASFSRAEHLRRHILNRHKESPTSYPCGDCEHVAESVRSLNVHRKIHTGFVCKTCGEKFVTKSNLSEHQKTHHVDVRPFLCSECGVRFIRNDYLVVHMRRHKGEKPYKCKFCDRAFPRATDLNVHERYHLNEKRYTCTVCGKGFQRSYNLTVHMRVHTGEKPYQCPHCSRSFSQGNDLKAHVRRHTGERYACDKCDATFIQTYLLNNHKKNVHGIENQTKISRVIKFDTTYEHEHTESGNPATFAQFTVGNS